MNDGQLVHLLSFLHCCERYSLLRWIASTRVTDSLRFINPLSSSLPSLDRPPVIYRVPVNRKKYPANISPKNESLRLKIEFSSSLNFSNSLTLARPVKFKHVRISTYIPRLFLETTSFIDRSNIINFFSPFYSSTIDQVSFYASSKSFSLFFYFFFFLRDVFVNVSHDGINNSVVTEMELVYDWKMHTTWHMAWCAR